MHKSFAVLTGLAVAACTTAPGPRVAIPDGWRYRDGSAAAAGRNGAVASDAPLASAVGIEVMKAGGNAVDAAVAVGFALAVVYPEAGNLGGGGFTVVRMADGRSAAIDYRETAPLAATRDMYLHDSSGAKPASLVGPLASGVPGSVAGLIAAHERFGVLPLARVMAPAIRLAQSGFPVDDHLARSLRSYQSRIAGFGGDAVFAPGGMPPEPGTILRQPALAGTLRAIAVGGADAFYRGELARRISSDLRNAGAIIVAEDLARYAANVTDPLRATYRGHTVLTTPPPSSGVTVVEALNVLEGFGTLPPFGSARYAHLLGSSLQRVFMDRNALLGDPKFVAIPLERLASKAHAAALRSTIGDRASATASLASTSREGMNTTHYSVVDDAGNAISTTTTLNALYGSGVFLPNAGFFMNDEMDDFASSPGMPNMFGLVQGEQNAIQPGKRMLSSMAPVIVLDRTGKPLLLVGARGGPHIISSVTQTIVNVIDNGMPLPQAINAPRVHHQARPDALLFERGGFSAAWADAMQALGYEPDSNATASMLRATGEIASVNGIMRSGDRWVAYADPRSGGRAAAY